MTYMGHDLGGIEIRSAKFRPYNLSNGKGGETVYEFWLSETAQRKYLPAPGEWAAVTSVAWDQETGEIGTLNSKNWKWS